MQSPAEVLDEFVRNGLIDQGIIPRILAENRRTRTRVEDLLVDLGYLTDRDLIEFKAAKLKIPYCPVADLSPDPAVVMLLPESLALGRAALAVEADETGLSVVVADPTDVKLLDEIRSVTRLRLRVAMCSRGEIVKKVSEYRDHYKAHAVEQLLKSVADPGMALTRRLGLAIGDLSDIAEQSTIVKAVNLILVNAVLRRASDIHVIPTARGLNVKYRIDGVLAPGQLLPQNIAAGVVNRIKILSKLDIAERRLPQDGSFHFSIDGRSVDLRVATTPTFFGEKVVMRILDKQGLLLGLENLGFTRDNYLKIRRNIRRPNGLILMVGPTGSGKTTSLYSALQALNDETRNITTVEDPVEYQIDGITQIQVHNDIGLSFANVLRSILRQDPDVVLVGEIRDIETTEIAIRASLTGHLVFATLHTNDAVSAVTRLRDMGTQAYLITSALRCVVSQRLVRTICVRCKTPAPAERDLLELLPKGRRTIEQFYRGQGCHYCFNTGYKGRTVISEVLEMSENLRRAVVEHASTGELLKIAVSEGMQPLLDDGLQKVAEGVTTLEEVLSVCDETGGMS